MLFCGGKKKYLISHVEDFVVGGETITAIVLFLTVDFGFRLWLFVFLDSSESDFVNMKYAGLRSLKEYFTYQTDLSTLNSLFKDVN